MASTLVFSLRLLRSGGDRLTPAWERGWVGESGESGRFRDSQRKSERVGEKASSQSAPPMKPGMLFSGKLPNCGMRSTVTQKASPKATSQLGKHWRVGRPRPVRQAKDPGMLARRGGLDITIITINNKTNHNNNHNNNNNNNTNNNNNNNNNKHKLILMVVIMVVI